MTKCLPRRMPLSPCCRMRRSTVQRATTIPRDAATAKPFRRRRSLDRVSDPRTPAQSATTSSASAVARDRGGTCLERVVTGRGDRHGMLGEHPANRLDPEPVTMIVDELNYHGSRGSSSRAKNEEAANRISLARFSSRFSASSSLIRVGIARRGPGPLARVDRGLLARAPQRVGIPPTRCPTRTTAAFNDSSGSSFRASATSRIARSRSSGGYFLGAGMVIPLGESDPPRDPGRFTHRLRDPETTDQSACALRDRLRRI